MRIAPCVIINYCGDRSREFRVRACLCLLCLLLRIRTRKFRSLRSLRAICLLRKPRNAPRSTKNTTARRRSISRSRFRHYYWLTQNQFTLRWHALGRYTWLHVMLGREKIFICYCSVDATEPHPIRIQPIRIGSGSDLDSFCHSVDRP